MKLQYKQIIFDEFTIEMENGEIVDISKINNSINLNNAVCAWGYVCKKCAKKYGMDINKLNKEPDSMVCYIDGCLQLNDIYSIYLDLNDIDNIEIIK